MSYNHLAACQCRTHCCVIRILSVIIILFVSVFLSCVFTTQAFAEEDSPHSWRYDGTHGDVSLQSAVTNPNGAKVFDWFDRFDRGYCTGNGAAKVIDVSEWQGNIDWNAVRSSGVTAAIIRCGYGKNFANQDDKKWVANVNGARAAGISVGVYLYSYAKTALDAAGEADHALRCMREQGLTPDKASLPVYYDMEDSTMGTDYVGFASVFCGKMLSAGYKAGVYANKNWWENKLTHPIFNSYYKWVAQWNASSGLDCKGFSNFPSSECVWQFSDYGKVPGIQGRVDLNYSYMNSAYKPISNTAAPGKKVVDEGTYEIISAADNRFGLDIAGALPFSGANVQLWIRNGTNAQRFKLQYSNGFYKITNAASGKALDVAAAAKHNGSNIQQYAGNGTDAQLWRIDEKDGSYVLTSKCNNKVMDVNSARYANGTNIHCWESNNSMAQRFILKKVDVPKSAKCIEPGIYRVSTALSDKGAYCMDVSGASKINGANIHLYKSNGTDAQLFRFSYDSDGYYRITNLASGKVMDVAGALPLNGTNIQSWASNHSAAQKWRVEENGDGTYTLISKCSGNAVDVLAGICKSGVNIQCWDENDTKAQKWYIEAVEE